MRSTLPLLAALALLLLPLTAAQVPAPPTPIYTVAITGAPAEFTGLTGANATASAPFQVTLTMGNVVCGGSVVIPVTVTATAAGAPSNMAVTLEPAVLNLTIGAGPHGSPPAGSAATSTGDVTATATITGNITANASVQVTLTANAPAPPGPPTGCQGAGGMGAATSDPVVVFANLTAPPPPPTPEPTPEDRGLPGFEVAALAAALALVAGATRRRRS